MLITARGRDILQSTVTLAQQQCHLDVVYGDTDSIMIHTGSTDLVIAKRLAQQVKRAVNERYKLLEIELDGVFEKLLLLRKKKYAALIVEESTDKTGAAVINRRLETKGLDMVRRDWSSLSVTASDYILNKLMFGTGSSEELVSQIHAYLEELATQMQSGKLPIDVFIINKNLTKDPESYADSKSQPHVMVALRMKQKGLTAKSGDTISYVICINPENNPSSLAERAYHPDEVRANPSLSIDVQWYLAQQIHPPVARLCECIEGTDSSRLALCLGLDARKFAIHSSRNSANQDTDSPRLISMLPDEEKYESVQKLHLTCIQCSQQFELTSVIKMSSDSNSSVHGMQCPRCSQIIKPQAAYCQVLALIRECLGKYHDYWLECDEPGCKVQTRRMRVYETRCINDNCRGSMRPKISGSQIYYQLLFLRSLFDWEKLRVRYQKELNDEGLYLFKRICVEYDPIRIMILHQLNQCSYPIINLREVFNFMVVTN